MLAILITSASAKVRTYRNLFEKYHVPRASFWLGFIKRALEHLNYEKIIEDYA